MLRRRELIGSALALGLLPAAASRAQDVASFHRAAFDARTLPELLQALKLAAPQPSPEVVLQGPELHEDGAVVPLNLSCSAPGVRQLLLCIDRNPSLLAALFEPGAAVEPRFSTRVKMQQTSTVRALAVLQDGRVLQAAREVKITLGGCLGAADIVGAERTVQPTLIRVQAAPGGALVRALMKHEMESGQRKDEAGRPIPAWHIQEVVARLNGQPVLQAQWGTSVSKNPFLQFNLKGAKPGDTVALAWADNRGGRRSDEVTFAAAT